jgi:hypothetical protein
MKLSEKKNLRKVLLPLIEARDKYKTHMKNAYSKEFNQTLYNKLNKAANELANLELNFIKKYPNHYTYGAIGLTNYRRLLNNLNKNIKQHENNPYINKN